MKNNTNHIITDRLYYAFKVRLASPLLVSSGLSFNTDSDVMKNGNDELFVPGTSLAGAFKEALKLEEKQDGIMGFSDGEQGKMSSLFISDLYFDQNSVVSERDGVRLAEDRTVDNKFDMEIIETGAEGTIYISCIVRDDQNVEEFHKAVKILLKKVMDGSLRIGANKTRGFGRLALKKENGKTYIYARSFTKDNFSDYLGFMKSMSEKNAETQNSDKDMCLSDYEKQDYETWAANVEPENEYVTIKVPLKLTGGISIRKYSTVPGEADYAHITCNGEPVIPGSSWNGAIRGDVRKILTGLGCKDVTAKINQWFGYIKHENKDSKAGGTGQQSLIVIGESIISDSVCMPMKRNKINRFDASVIEGAFYQDLSYFGGATELEIMVKKDESRAYLALIGVLNIVIQDIQNGYLAVGGQSAIGRGIFESNGDIVISESVEDADAALYAMI